MDHRIRFETKDQSNARRQQAFVDLSPSERFLWFLRSFMDGTHRAPKPANNNFIIHKRGHALRG
jgi:hypothetical protein